MSSSRALLAACLAAALGACGFQPLYKKDASEPGVTDDLARIRILNVNADLPEYDRLGQQMHNMLLQRLNPDGSPAEPFYRLDTQLSVTKVRTGIQITEEATRARLTVSVNFKLLDSTSGRSLYTGSEQSTNSYNVADSQFATLSAENDAARRAVREVSDSIRLRLGLFFQRERSG
ncbi:MAG: hypothetical protein GEU87_02110 [Alphaproteobacteria bacterium]|nr:hypothetical protein [Alphaproteobacteria bacterium]